MCNEPVLELLAFKIQWPTTFARVRWNGEWTNNQQELLRPGSGSGVDIDGGQNTGPCPCALRTSKPEAGFCFPAGKAQRQKKILAACSLKLKGQIWYQSNIEI